MPLIYFCRWISDQTGVSVIVAQGLDSRPVTVDVVNVPVDQLLTLVARRLGSQVVRTGDLFFLGSLRPEDRGVLVRRVFRLDKDGIVGAVGVLLSEYGRVQAFEDGLVLVGDRVQVLQRVSAMFDQVEAAPLDTWVVQLYLVSMSRSDSHDFGFDAVPALKLSASLVAGSGAGAAEAVLTGGLDAVLRASESSASVYSVGRPLFVLVDGATAKQSSVKQLPIVTVRTERDGGVSIDAQEVDYLPVGLQLELGLRDVAAGRARVDLSVELSSVPGFLNDQPIKLADTFSTSAVVRSGGVYLLGSLVQSSRGASLTGPVSVGVTATRDGRVMQVWLRCYRIGEPVRPGG